ncbi:hypothetical protein [Haloterrigena salina]|uniref:hypothetical protein n=1 Tax=Haloterrigena salina TaxID=504937 RepID=UPI001EF9C938|nr:hypothetical protein [Haloterrigena salina]
MEDEFSVELVLEELLEVLVGRSEVSGEAGGREDKVAPWQAPRVRADDHVRQHSEVVALGDQPVESGRVARDVDGFERPDLIAVTVPLVDKCASTSVSSGTYAMTSYRSVMASSPPTWSTSP